MKKNKLFLMSLLLIPALAGCNGYTYVPKNPYPGDPFNQNEGADPDQPEIDAEFNMTVYFYLDYSHSEQPKDTSKTDDEYVQTNPNEPVFVMKWYMLKPLGECPERAKLTDADAADPLYGKFLGYSEYPSCIDGSKLWDFKQDYKQFNILNLYGIWVSNVQEVNKMKSRLKLLFLLPCLLLASCNFKYSYTIKGLVTGGDGIDEVDDGIDDAGTYNIKVWVDDKIVSLTQTQIQEFVSASGGKYTINATVEPQSEGTAASSMLQDVQSGADIFVFAQDQLARLKVAGAVSKLTGNYETFVRTNNSEDSVKAASLTNGIYAYPITSDNGYFLYYDKSYISDEDAKNMTTILERCRAAKKVLNFEGRSNGFYAASYFLATGCTSEWELDETTGKFKSYTDTFSGDNGVIAGKGLKEIADTSVVASNSQASKLNGTAAAVISGVWEYEVALNRLGPDRLGCAKMPSFTVDGQTYQLGSYDGYKLMGVKPQVDAKKASVCRKLARYLTSGSCQTERFKEVSWGPTNKEAAEREEVKSHPGLAALYAQHEYATQQGQCPGAWFVALSTTAKAITTNSSDADIRAVLQNYKNGLDELLSEDQEVRA